MSARTTQNLDSTKQSNTGTVLNQINTIAYLLLGLCFVAFLILSAVNDYLFFEWLSMGAFIVFALIGMHFIGQKQIRRN
ncbi:MAG: hypothetical protein AAGC45_10425 [Bacteroidota bacterium]